MVLRQQGVDQWGRDEAKLFMWSLGYGYDLSEQTVEKYQRFNCEDYALAGLEVYDRLPDIDGVFGKATKLAISRRQCLVPDFPDEVTGQPPNFDTLSDEHRRLIRSLSKARPILLVNGPKYGEESTTGSGSWKAGCYDSINPVRHVVKVHFNTSSWRSNWKQNEDKIIDACIKSAARRGVYLVKVDQKSEANLHVSHRNGSGWIGLAQLPGSNPSCRLQLFCYVDTRYWQGIDSACQLLMHELGHNLNLPHVSQSSRNVMSPRITWRNEGFVGFADNDASTPRLQRYFGTEPYPLYDSEPEPEPDPEGKVIAEFEIEQPGTYQLVKKGGVIQI